MIEQNQIITPKELADILKVKPGTIYSWISRKVDLPPFVKIGGSVRWNKDSIEKWFQKKESLRKRRNFEQ